MKKLEFDWSIFNIPGRDTSSGMNVSPPWIVSGLSKSTNKESMIGFKLDNVESWLNEETMERNQSCGDKNSLSKRGGGRKGGAS